MMNIKTIKHAFKLHFLIGLCFLLGGLSGCGESSNSNPPNAAVDSDSSEVTPEERINLHYGIFSNSLMAPAQTDQGQLKSSSEFGDITSQNPSNNSSNSTERLTVASTARSDSCLNIGEDHSSCSSSSSSSDGSFSSDASAEAAGDSTINETNTSEDGSSSSSSSSHNGDSGSSRTNQVTTEGSLLVERPGEDSGDSAETLKLYPVGELGLYLGQVIPNNEQIESSDLSSSQTIKEYTSGLIFASEKSTEIHTDNFSGEYGFIGIESSLGDEIRFLGVVGKKSISDDMQITESRSNHISILRPAGGQIIASEDVSLHDATGFSLDSTGSMVGGDKKVLGFVNKNAGALIYVGQTPSYSQNNLGNGSGLSMALKLPTNIPNLTGQTYHLLSMTTGLTDQGLQLGAITSGKMHFNSDNTVSLKDLVEQKSALPFAGGDVDLVTTTSNHLNLSFVLEENGHLKIAGIETGEGPLELEGYVSANGEMIVMRGTLINETSNKFEIGMVVGIKN